MRQHLAFSFPETKNISLSTIYRNLKENNFSYKKITKTPVQRNSLKIKEKRFLLCKQLVYSLWKKYNVIFVDETSLCLNFKKKIMDGEKEARNYR